MVSFWPFKGDDKSPASFEKSLSAIAKKIGTTQGKLESNRQQSRRFKALWTLYTSLAYLLYVMVEGLVVGLKNAGILELGGLFGTPLVIYGIRQAISSVYAYSISSQQAHLEGLQKQRDGIIKKLKDATKYDSTQQLLEKYGGTPAKPKKHLSNKKSLDENQEQPAVRNGRTMIVPPPTANIPRGPLTAPYTPPKQAMAPGPQPPLTAAAATPPWAQNASPVSPEGEEFAPNAFPPATYYAQPGSEYGGGKWYDRIMDVLLGEDESHPKNRIVLICKNCRLVNGQAPPGVKSLIDVGKWRCSSCGTMNGEDSEMQKIVAEIQGSRPETTIEDIPEEDSVLVERADDQSDVTQYSDDEGLGESKSAQSGRETRSATARKGRKFEE